MNQPPENPQLLQQQIQPVQGELFCFEALQGRGDHDPR
jgi:hypothetical protein